ncbi:DNA replication/repair protein RecF [Teredinibacter sp. KSP-S5-2]|uniref:DNA replication/repair protein RecF n=1 Tax=Teredinibacter sp. KSP-S5-2 TaxID=3034506 RepID=UPI0029346251|nr:DNA replication/repair protein RecF [Teredinibacter sp. KSP-S5-2]WNO09132.1 DNA replication/repair protein RecF [Teredinibacter sp. KSP-S5-2]
MPYISRLSITQFRNILSADISPSPDVNFIYGENGSGKTSLLESISYLAHGRSFRTRKYRQLVGRNCDRFVLYTDVVEQDQKTGVGIERAQRGESRTRASGRAVSSSAELASLLPILVLNTHSFELLEGSPKIRRQYFDWLVFHVKHRFGQCWKDYTKCLKQRNSLLRSGKITYQNLEPWDQELTRLSEQIRELRADCLRGVEVAFAAILSRAASRVGAGFSNVSDIQLVYDHGWDDASTLTSLLADSFERDKKLGYTNIGPHKAQFKVMLGNANAIDYLSRGQQKVIITALFMTLARVFKDATLRSPVFLLDDLPAELDGSNRNLIQDWIREMNSQVFITGIEKKQLLAGSWLERQGKVFHVKHGTITEEPQAITSV